LQTLEDNRASSIADYQPRRIFPEGKTEKGVPYAEFRWSRLKNSETSEMFGLIGDRLFPWMRELGGETSLYARHMDNARFTIPMEDRDTKGDLYEYLLSKIASAGQNGQFRTPRHIIQLMVELTAPKPGDIICDPACGTCGFLVAASEYLRDHHGALFSDKRKAEPFHNAAFHGYDFDSTMLRIGSMNMLLHGVDSPVDRAPPICRPATAQIRCRLSAHHGCCVVR
jgi:type I restriction enzyme M protein